MEDPVINTSELCNEEKITLLEKQYLVVHTNLLRIQADIESEKGTRSRANAHLSETIEALDKRIRILEKSIWVGFGMLAVIQYVLK